MTIPSLYGIGSFIVGCVFLAAAVLQKLSWSALVSFAWR